MSVLDDLGLTADDLREAAAESILARPARPVSSRGSGDLPLGMRISGADILREGLRVDERERSASRAELPPMPAAGCSVEEARAYDGALLDFLEEAGESISARFGDRLLAQSDRLLATARDRRGTRASGRGREPGVAAELGLSEAEVMDAVAASGRGPVRRVRRPYSADDVRALLRGEVWR